MAAPRPVTPGSLAAQGSYWTASNATPGTPLAFAINAAVSETAGNFLYVKNTASLSQLVLHYIRLISGVIPAAGVSGHFFVKADTTDRYTSGGVALAAVNTNTAITDASKASVYAGALTTGAGTATRLLCRGVLRSAIPVTLDEWVLQFGFSDCPPGGSLGGTVAQRNVIPCPPVVVGPGHNICLQLWFPSNAVTAGTFEVEVGWWER